MRRIDLDAAHERFAAALAAAPNPTETRADALIEASKIEYRAGSLARGEAYVREGEAIAGELGLQRTRWRALQRLGEFAVGKDAAPPAIDLFEQARQLAHEQEMPAAEALSLYSVGVARWLDADIDTAEQVLGESLERLHGAEPAAESIQSLLNIAEARPGHAAGKPPLRIVFEETLQPFHEISCAQAIGYVLANLATIARLREEPERAAELLDEAAQRFERDGDRRGEAAVLVRRAYLELASGEHDAARECFERALEIRRELADRRGVGIALSGLGMVGTAAGEYERAERELQEASALFRRAGDRWGLVSSLWRMADLAIARGRFETAAAALEEAREVVGETGREGWIEVTEAMQAEVAAADRAQPERTPAKSTQRPRKARRRINDPAQRNQ
jgi:tetratricopeptide (TPR) repeat protein